jgi:hypothetical protein
LPERAFQFVIENLCPCLEQEVCSTVGPLHLLLLDEPSAHDMVGGGAGAEEGNLVVPPAASLRPAAARYALCAGWVYGPAEGVPFRSYSDPGDLRWRGLVGGGRGCGWMEIGGGVRARRAMPTHRKVRDGWGARRVVVGWRWGGGRALREYPLIAKSAMGGPPGRIGMLWQAAGFGIRVAGVPRPGRRRGCSRR